MKIIKWILSIFFFILITIELYLTVFKQIPLNKMSVLLLLVLITVFQLRHKVSWYIAIAVFVYGIFSIISWYIAIAVFVYGIFSIIFYGINSSESILMEFTSPLSYLLFSDVSGKQLKIFIEIIPDYFYLISLIVFFTKPVRRYYGVLKQ